MVSCEAWRLSSLRETGHACFDMMAKLEEMQAKSRKAMESVQKYNEAVELDEDVMED